MYELTLIIGHVGRDAEMRYTPTGVPVTNFSVAVNHKYTDASGQTVERVKWYRVTAWRKLAETCGQYVKKGSRILVAGEVQAAAWLDKEGAAHAALELTADTVRFLGDARGGADETPETPGAAAESSADIPF